MEAREKAEDARAREASLVTVTLTVTHPNYDPDNTYTGSTPERLWVQIMLRLRLNIILSLG